MLRLTRLLSGAVASDARSLSTARTAAAAASGGSHGKIITADYTDFRVQPREAGDALIGAMAAAARRAGMTVMHQYCHTFDAGGEGHRPGFTSVVLLDESHITAHCYTDTHQLALDAFTCGGADTSQVMADVHATVLGLAPAAVRTDLTSAERFASMTTPPPRHAAPQAPALPALVPQGEQLKSEYDAIPAAVLLCNTSHSFGRLQQMRLGSHLWDFREHIDQEVWDEQHANLCRAIQDNAHPDTKVLLVNDVLADDSKSQGMVMESPDLAFMRDPIITMPWLPGRFFPSEMKSSPRLWEPEIASAAALKLGLTKTWPKSLEQLDSPPCSYSRYFFDGGDIIPFYHDGTRHLLIGTGGNTNVRTAQRLAEQLVPAGLCDKVIAVDMAAGRMNLDECFVPLAHDVAAAHAPSLLGAYCFTGTETRLPEHFDFLKWVKDLGMTLSFEGQEPPTFQSTLDFLNTNFLCLGHSRTVVGYDLDPAMVEELTRLDINVVAVPGSELIKGDGGVRCLTRPIYL